MSSKFGLINVKSTSAGGLAMVGAETAPIEDDNGRPGWAFVKTAESSAAAKFNYYFYDGTYHTTKVKNLDSMYFVGCVDRWTSNVNEVPYIVLYTPMTGSGDAGAWYHSKHAYIINVNQIIQSGERCVFYAGKEPKKDFDGARKIRLRERIDTGEYNPEDPVYLVSLHTDSAAPLVNVVTEHLGCDISKHSYHTDERSVNIALAF